MFVRGNETLKNSVLSCRGLFNREQGSVLNGHCHPEIQIAGKKKRLLNETSIFTERTSK